MPFVTALPPTALQVGVDGGIVVVPTARLVNFFGTSQEFAGYEQPTSDLVLEPGDTTNLSQGDGTDVLQNATYLGKATIDAVSAGITLPLGLGGLTIDVLPREVDIFSAGTPPTAQMVTETPFNQANLMVRATLTPPLGGDPVIVEVPITGVVEALGLGVVAPAVNGLVGTVVNTAVLTVTPDTGATKVIPPGQALCFARGTMIETEHGPMAVEDLTPGTRVMTRDNGLRPISWIGSKTYSEEVLAAASNLRPIRIKAGALGPNTPARDLVVSPQHRILVRSKIALRMFGAEEVLVAAKQLVLLDGVDVATDLAEVEYFHFLFDRHEIVFAEGAETESLYTGTEALKTVGRAALEEIFSIFPELRDQTESPAGARALLSGRVSRKLAARHAQHGRPLVSNH